MVRNGNDDAVSEILECELQKYKRSKLVANRTLLKQNPIIKKLLMVVCPASPVFYLDLCLSNMPT